MTMTSRDGRRLDKIGDFVQQALSLDSFSVFRALQNNRNIQHRYRYSVSVYFTRYSLPAHVSP